MRDSRASSINNSNRRFFVPTRDSVKVSWEDCDEEEDVQYARSLESSEGLAQAQAMVLDPTAALKLMGRYMF